MVAQGMKSKQIILSMNCSTKTCRDWIHFTKNTCTRFLKKLTTKLGGPGKTVMIDETHMFRIPKNHVGTWKMWNNWCFVAVEKDSSLFIAQLVRRRTRPALETIIHEFILPGTKTLSDEHKSCHWLGKTTKQNVCQPCRPALCEHIAVCHKKTFKATNGTCTNKVEGLNCIVKKPTSEANGVTKELISENIDVPIFKGWLNSKLPFSETSHSSMEKDKLLNVWVGFVAAISHTYCQTSETNWEIDDNLVSEGALAPINNDLHDGFKDQGHMKNDKDKPKDDIFCEKLKKKQMLKVVSDENIKIESSTKKNQSNDNSFEIEDIICTVKKCNDL